MGGQYGPAETVVSGSVARHQPPTYAPSFMIEMP
jgi:hypothetical protein